MPTVRIGVLLRAPKVRDCNDRQLWCTAFLVDLHKLFQVNVGTRREREWEGREGGRPMTKAENEGLMKNHNRIIKLMSGTDPASAGAEDDHGADGTPTTYAFAMPSFDF